MKSKSLAPAEIDLIEKDVNHLAKEIAANATEIESSIKTAMGYIEFISKTLRVALIYPISIVFAVVVLLSLVPIGLIWLWA